MKIRLVGAELFHAGRRTDGRTDGRTDTDMTKPIVAFHNFANAPKEWTDHHHTSYFLLYKRDDECRPRIWPLLQTLRQPTNPASYAYSRFKWVCCYVSLPFVCPEFITTTNKLCNFLSLRPVVPKLCFADHQGISDQNLGDPWTYFYNGYFEVYPF